MQESIQYLRILLLLSSFYAAIPDMDEDSAGGGDSAEQLSLSFSSLV